MNRTLYMVVALLLVHVSASAREITVTPFPGPAFRPGYWMVVKVALDDVANVTHVRLRNAASGLAVEVPVDEARSGMPVLFHRIPEKVQITLLDGERQIEQQAVPIKLTPLGEKDVSLLVVTNSPTWSRQAVAALPKAPRLVAQIRPKDLSSRGMQPDPYSHLALDPAVIGELDEAAQQTILRHLTLGGIVMLPRSVAPPGALAKVVITEESGWQWLTIPQVATRPAGNLNVDQDLVMAFERPRWPAFLKDWTLMVLAGGVLILLVGWLLSWAVRWRWLIPAAAAIALAAMLAGTAFVQQYVSADVHGQLRILAARADQEYGRVEIVSVASALQDVETCSWGHAPVYYLSEQGDKETLVFRPNDQRWQYHFALDPWRIKVFRTVELWPRDDGALRTRREGPNSWMAARIPEDGWLVRADQAVAVGRSMKPGRLAFDGAHSLGDVIDELVSDENYYTRMRGRLLKYVRNSRRLQPDRTYYVTASWWDPSMCLLDIVGLDEWGYLRIIELP